MFHELTTVLAGLPEEISFDSPHIKAHRCAGGGKGGPLFRPSFEIQNTNNGFLEFKPCQTQCAKISRDGGIVNRTGDCKSKAHLL